MKTLISPVPRTKSYTVIPYACQSVGRCAGESMSPNDYKYSTVFMKFVTLLRKKTNFADIPLRSMGKAAQRDCSWRVWYGISLVTIPLRKVMRAHLYEPDSVPSYSHANWVQWFRINCNWDTNLTCWVKFQDSSCIQAPKSLDLHFPGKCLYR